MPQSATPLPSVESILFPDLFDKPLHVQFNAQEISSDGGVPLLAAVDRHLGLSAALNAALADPRDPGKIEHAQKSLILQRIIGICCDYEDLNDATPLRNDPLFNLACQTRSTLASAPTLSRLEHRASLRDLFKMGYALADSVLAHHARLRQKVRRVTIDMDATVDPAHGAQQGVLFNGYYDTHCYLPLLAFLTFHDAQGREEAEQYLLSALLRPGTGNGIEGARGVLRRIFARLRQRFPGVIIRVRLDGGFAAPEMFDFLQKAGVEYVINMASNNVLKKKAEELMIQARLASTLSGESERYYGSVWYQAGSWDSPQRVIIKAEVLREPGKEPKDNLRCVITNLTQTPEHLYAKIYCVRGDSENRIKELKNCAALGRTSATLFLPNQFRVLLSAAAYVIFQELRRGCEGTELERAQVETLRNRLLKLGAVVERVTRKIWLSLPLHAPAAALWCQVARLWGATVAT